LIRTGGKPGRKPVVLCADDYGLSPGVSSGIRELIDQGRLSATSCMVVYPEFEADGPLLKPYFGQADFGLHFTLTADRSVKSLMRDAYLGRLNAEHIAEELERQLGAFVRVMGMPPDYIDGHQHVHLLPGVREPVTEAAARLGAYVRSTREPVDWHMALRPSPVESAFLSLTARPLAKLIRGKGLTTNRGFRGVRGFREAVPYAKLFRRMIAGAGAGSLVMCHPGIADRVLAARDPVTGAREEELRYFASAEFPAALAAEDLALSRLRDALRD
jgi:predicted glycoside hydrolase/deacetylase ChbG (UPF0249 family)